MPAKKPSARFIVHPLIKPQTLEARIYQQTILASCAKENTLVVLPTGLGKTAIMLLVALHRLEQFPEGVVLVLAPSKPLVEQHRETFQRTLTEPEMVHSLTGAIPPSKRQAIWGEARIAIATPQIVQNDIISGIFRPEHCIALAIDEAHRTRGNYAYVFVAETYLKRAEHALISAFTASPGTSLEAIQGICDILEITTIESRTEKDPDVRPYVQPVQMELIRVQLSKEFQTLQTQLKQCLEVQVKRLKEGGFHLSKSRLKRKEVLEIQKEIQQAIQSEVPRGDSLRSPLRDSLQSQAPTNLFAALGAASNTIRLLHGNELLETQGITAFSKYLISLTQRKQTRALQNLSDNPAFQRMRFSAEKLAEGDHPHPKFGRVKAVVDHQLTKNPHSRILIFSRFRVTLKLLAQELAENSLVRSQVFIGQQTRAQDRGMTQREQYSTLQAFKEGKINVLLATNIGEEGIDVTTCDLVVFYDAVSPIRTIQRRGRTGRKAPGKVVVLVTQGTQEEGLYWSSQRKERDMHAMMKVLADYSRQLKHETSHQTLDQFVKPEPSPAVAPAGLAALASDRSPNDRGRGTIAVDQRETNSAVVKCLYELGFDVQLIQLQIADYIIGDLAIERKTSEDFIQSLIDGRLFRETKNMTMEYSTGVLILEGEKPFISRRSIDPKALKGAIASIILDFGVPILQTGGPEETADLIAALARRVFRETQRPPRITTGRSPTTLSERQTRVIATLPQINSVLARRLLSEFKTPKNLLLASKEDLQQVKGVGPGIAAKIRETIDSEYSE